MMNAAHAYLNAFIDGKLDSFTTHVWLVGIIAIAEISLGFGIWLESPKNKTCREWLGVVLVLGGCVFSVIATVGLLIFDEGISRGQQSTIEGQNKQIADLEWQNGNLTTELLHVAVPRRLNAAAFKDALFAQHNASFEVVFDESSTDAPDLSLAIWAALKNLGWSTTQSGPLPLPPSPTSPRWVPRTVAAGGSQWGITVVLNKPMAPIRDGIPMTPATSPEFWLMAALGGAIGDRKEDIHSGVVPDLPDNTFRIVVGAKSPSYLPLLQFLSKTPPK